MAQSSPSSRKFAACILVLCCLGGGTWYFLHEEGKSPVETARNLMQNLTGEKSDQSASSASSSAAEKSVTAAGAAGEENTPQQVGAALNAGGRPVPLDPQAELLARVDRAMEKSGPAAPDGDSASGKVVDQPPQADAARRDSVVTPRFVNDMAGWLAANYIPSHHEGRGGRSSVTLVQVNARYSNSGTLRSVERDPLKSRASILSYVFTPGMLEALYRMYAPSFMEEMERAARENRRGRTLSEAQVADMFSVYADKFQRLAVSLDAAAKVDLTTLAAAIRREAGNEAEANDSFARAYLALSAARESGNRDEVAIQSRRMAESTRVAGMYASRQERARNDMAYAISRKAEGRTLASSELLFLGEWLSRRGCTAEATLAAADVCRRMAEQMKQRADDILNRRESAAAAGQAPAAAENAASPAPSAEKSAAAPATSSSAASSAEKPAASAASPASPGMQAVENQPEAAVPAEEKPAPSGSSPAPAPSAESAEASAAAPASAGKEVAPATPKSENAAPAQKTSGGNTASVKPSYPEVSGSLTREAPAADPARNAAADTGAAARKSAASENGSASAPAAAAVPAEGVQAPAGGDVPAAAAPVASEEQKAASGATAAAAPVRSTEETAAGQPEPLAVSGTSAAPAVPASPEAQTSAAGGEKAASTATQPAAQSEAAPVPSAGQTSL